MVSGRGCFCGWVERQGSFRRRIDCSKPATELDLTIHVMEVMLDHVHLFVEGGPTICVAEIVNGLKGFTSHTLREEFPFLKSRLSTLWSRSYYAGSVGSVSESVVRKYIEGQKRK